MMLPIPVGQFEFFFLGALCLVPVLWFVIAILIGIWVYRDAESRGMSGALWLIIVFLLSLIGLIIYLVVRKEKRSSAPTPPPPA